MDLLVKFAVAALLIAALWLLLIPRREFVVRIAAGKASISRGKLPPGFLQEVNEVCATSGVTDGAVWGVRRGQRISLGFSDSIPEPCRQRLRNLWNLPR
jgi:hypothetical protein